MDPARLRRPDVLLTQLFLRQFLQNDLISPDADRSQLIAVVGALVVSLTMFISVGVSANYVMVVLMPGQAAMISLSDKFFYLGLAMIVTALVAATQWDALAVEPRDAAILEPLPIDPSTIRRAKIAAVAILGTAVAVAVNFFPSLVFPWFLVFNFPQLSVFGLLRLVVVHAMFTVAAALFGYLAIVALRETLAVLLGTRGFTRVSPWVQGALIVVLGSCLLLLPPTSTRVGAGAFDDWRAATPPMWFLGAYEMTIGHIIFELPRERMNPRQAAREEDSTAHYRDRRAQFPALARQAGVAFAAVLLVAILAHMVNARRLPSLAPAPPPAFRRRWRLVERSVNTLLVRDPATRAGFYFTLAAMWRSNTHRLTIACAAAAGFAMAVLAVSRVDLGAAGVPPARLLAMQPLLYGALLVGFRHVIRVPAELRANWGFQLAWRNRERAYIAGVKRAAFVALAVPAVAVLMPFHLIVLDTAAALTHAAFGLAGAVVLLEALMVSYDKVPFTCTYLPSENMKALGPIYAIAFVSGASIYARMEHAALFGGAAARLVLTLAVVFVVARIMSRTRARVPQVEFDEAPMTYRRLGLDS